MRLSDVGVVQHVAERPQSPGQAAGAAHDVAAGAHCTESPAEPVTANVQQCVSGVAQEESVAGNNGIKVVGDVAKRLDDGTKLTDSVHRRCAIIRNHIVASTYSAAVDTINYKRHFKL